jgi:hypothetical protein
MSIGGGDCIANIWIRSDHGRLQQERNLVTGRIFSKRGNTGTGLDRIAIAPALVDLCWVHDTPGRYGGSGPSAHPRQRGIGRRTFLRTATTRSIPTCWPSRRRVEGRKKRKGDFSCEISPFLSAFVEDLVRLPNHNAVIPKSFGPREPGPRFLHFSSITSL